MSVRVSSSCSEGGYAMAALLVTMSVMAVVMSVALPVWQTAARREREAELIFRGQQYARAVTLFQRSRGGFPPSIDVLVNERFLRKRYKDPMTEDGEFQVLYLGQAAGAQAGQGGRGQPGAPPISGIAPPLPGATVGAMLGVASKNTGTSLRLYNGRGRYNEWTFVATQATTQPGGVPGVQAPGGRGGTQNPGGRGGLQDPNMPQRGGRGFGGPGGFGGGVPPLGPPAGPQRGRAGGR